LTQSSASEQDQISIIRDLVSLQLQLRYWPDTLEHRIHLLQAHPKLRTNWVGLAVAYHLNKQYDNAIDVLNKFEEMQVDAPKRDYDTSELVLYHALVLEEAGRKQEALAYLNARQSLVTDRVGFGDKKGAIGVVSCLTALRVAQLDYYLLWTSPNWQKPNITVC
jgi:tetratricopeptide (TPR) repeat protein